MEYKNLDSFMDKFNFTSSRLGRKVGVTRQIVHYWRTGKGKPCAENMKKLQKIVSEYTNQKAETLFEKSKKKV